MRPDEIQGLLGSDKAAREREDMLQLLHPLPRHLRDEITALWDEYEAAATPEARETARRAEEGGSGRG